MESAFKIGPDLDSVIAELEIQRKKIASNKIQGWGMVALGIAIFAMGSILSSVVAAVIGFTIVIPGAIILFRLNGEIKIYRSRFKQEIVAAALSHVDQSLTIQHLKGIPRAEFDHSQLFTQEPDRYFTEDLVTGKVDKTAFYFAEVHAEYKTETQTKSGRQVQWHDIFKGIIFVADFNKHFNGVTVVRPKDIGSSIGAWFSKNIYAFGNKEVIELENPHFIKNFVTYSNDQVEARYILTPSMMEKISDLNERSAYCISLSFINSAMYIAFPLDENYFEPPVFKTLLKPDLLERDLSILRFMYHIVQEMDLNTRIWTKN
jgi:hypothetical protein